MMALRFLLLISILFIVSPAWAELLGKEWISEAELKKQSAFARNNGLVLAELKCRFRENVENPGRGDVIFRADFKIADRPVPWGWTFDANAVNQGPENQARAAGLSIASEDYFEVSSGVWVLCRVWQRL